MEAEEGPARRGEKAAAAETTTTATTQIQRGGELTAILSAITQINERLGKMDARLGAVESASHALGEARAPSAKSSHNVAASMEMEQQLVPGADGDAAVVEAHDSDEEEDNCMHQDGTHACHECGTRDPGPDHTCVAKCSLCEGARFTGAKGCSRRFVTPYVIRRREQQQRRQAQGQHQVKSKQGLQQKASVEQQRLSRRDRSSSQSRRDRSATPRRRGRSTSNTG
ncbi:hypothetical protein HPB48_017022 [Haemaphysalis longicornis]|uniref:Uncharacterized protein n=1 Tax=Haemaphysalis longicornis TaxID=44386 RepID=A0A9J6FNY0_HAELO|nr:hypothetical protein HPB48_017022 [Haemaphysalis longicornis]